MTGKTAVITGGNTGLGLKTALELSRRGADVVIGSRSVENGEAAVAAIKAEVPSAKASHLPLELTDPLSIEAFASAFANAHGRLDILLNNAGVVIHPTHVLTQTGRELQMQVNHLGHFHLTCLLMPLITKTRAARIVQSTTVPYQKGDINLDDLDWRDRKYNAMQAYFDSRLAQLLFACRLNNLFEQGEMDAIAISMQPGLVATEGLQNSEFGGWIMKAIAQPLAKGCRTHLRTCTDPSLTSGKFWEPRFKLFGNPTPKALKPEALDQSMARDLITKSQELTGCELNL